jgi:hypothetical protein
MTGVQRSQRSEEPGSTSDARHPPSPLIRVHPRSSAFIRGRILPSSVPSVFSVVKNAAGRCARRAPCGRAAIRHSHDRKADRGHGTRLILRSKQNVVRRSQRSYQRFCFLEDRRLSNGHAAGLFSIPFEQSYRQETFENERGRCRRSPGPEMSPDPHR